MKISLTDFVDFIALSGGKRLTKVKQIRERGKYDPKTDFYKRIRDGIIQNQKNSKDTGELDKIVATVTDKKKKDNYTAVLNGYKKFMGKKKFESFDVPKKNWSYKELNMKLNPELGLIIKGEPHIVKLYFKKDKIEKDKVNSIICFMENELSSMLREKSKFCVLDITNSRIHYRDKRRIDFMPLIMGEADSFITIWNNLDKK
ncbi:MAG: hypothetical protein JST55_16380 [Bacteroidetes bacterium]|nr:hypothetical protein [Bacteroidota bacterium]